MSKIVRKKLSLDRNSGKALDANDKEAIDQKLDQAFFVVSRSTFSKFQALLISPLMPTDELRRLLKTKAPWRE